MSFMFEVYYGLPASKDKEEKIEEVIASFDGQLTYREEPRKPDDSKYICLTFEFSDIRKAEEAASQLRDLGEHVEGVQVYGD